MNIIKIQALGLEAYLKEGTTSKWLLPVCSSVKASKLSLLSPNHPGNWEDVDIDGCPTMCYRLTTKEIKSWRGKKLSVVWPQFAERIGNGPAREYFGQLYIRYNNIKASARNRWEKHHGGIRVDRFDRGMSVRESASLSIS